MLVHAPIYDFFAFFSVGPPGSGPSKNVSAAIVTILAVLASLFTVALCLLVALILLRRYNKMLSPGSPNR